MTTQPLTFFHFPGACSQAVYVGLEEAGATYTAQAVNLIAGAQKSPDYLKLNPAGQVPALALPDGQVLSEASAILFWLAETHPAAKLLPSDPRGRARALEWMSFAAYSLHAVSGPIWGPERYLADPAAHAEIKAGAEQRYRNGLALAEARLGAGPWLLGESFSIADCHLLPFWHWAQRWKFDLAAFPNLAAWHARMSARPSVIKVLAEERTALKALLAK
ncbi:MAG: glutathione S-transferase family protein [Betaproteobacteria bacterium]|nr:glutathione S-transferase family protein [Betaproteobacteria bacterium]